MTAVALGLTLLEPTASFLSQPRVLRRHEPSRGSSSRTTGFRLKAAVAPEDVMIVMNGLPGAMGLEVAAACRRRGFQLAPVALPQEAPDGGRKGRRPLHEWERC